MIRPGDVVMIRSGWPDDRPRLVLHVDRCWSDTIDLLFLTADGRIVRAVHAPWEVRTVAQSTP